MRLIFLLLALAAAATAHAELKNKPGNVETLKKQRDMVLLLDNILGDVKDPELNKFSHEYRIEENIDNYSDQSLAKYVLYLCKLRYIQRKGIPYTASIGKLRKELALLTRFFLAAKDYTTFVKTAAWARRNWNEDQFVKAFIFALLKRPETRDIVVLPPYYEILPHYFFDARVIRDAQMRRAKCWQNGTKDVIEIPGPYTSQSPKRESNLAHFTEDIGVNSYYSLFKLARWLLPRDTRKTDDTTAFEDDCEQCEINRGAQYYYVHQQLVARYNLERSSNRLLPVEKAHFRYADTFYESHLGYVDGIEFPGRGFNVNLEADKADLVRLVRRLEQRLLSTIEKNALVTKSGSSVPLYSRKGLSTLGYILGGTRKSPNIRYYGQLEHVARELLGGGFYTSKIYEPYPSILEVDSTAARDPMFYRLFKRIISLFEVYQESLPPYKAEDLKVPGVEIKRVKFDRLANWCEKVRVDIDSATTTGCEKDKKDVKVEAVIERLTYKPYKWEVLVHSDKFIKGAVVRLFMGPKYALDATMKDLKNHRTEFIEMDQFLWDIKEGETLITRKATDSPLRSGDATTKKDLLRKIEDALNSKEPFYAEKISQISGFPERLGLPKGRLEGFPVQMVVIISPPTVKPTSYGPVTPPEYETYQNVDFEEYLGDHDEEVFRSAWRGSGLDREKNDNAPVGKTDYLDAYYKDKKAFETIGGCISLDGRPLGFPFDRPLTTSAIFVPNMKTVDVMIYYSGMKCHN